LCFYRGL